MTYTVATRRLGRYLSWFSWTQQFRGGSADMRELVSREALSGGYEATVRGIFAEPRFQMEYWEARGWSAASQWQPQDPKHEHVFVSIKV